MDASLILPFEFSKMRLPSTTERPVTEWSRYDTRSLILNTQTGEDLGLILSLLYATVRMSFTSRMPISMDPPLLQLGCKYGFEVFEVAGLRGYEQLRKAVLDETLRAARGYEFRLLDVIKSPELDDLHPGALYICKIIAESDHGINLPAGHNLSSTRRRLTEGSVQHISGAMRGSDAHAVHALD